MVRIDSLKTDLSLAEGGKWFFWEGDARLKIRSAECKDVQEAIQKSGIGARAMLSSTSERDRRALRAIYASRVLVDWEGLQDADGNEIAFSKHLALQFFEMKELSHLYEFVVGKANSQRAFRGEEGDEVQDLEELDGVDSPIEDAGNSSGS